MAANCKQDNKYPPHPCPCPEIPGPPGSQGPVGPPSDCCFDSGWINLEGFNFMQGTTDPTRRPQYRVMNKVIHFRGDAVIPLEIQGALIPYTSETQYSSQLSVQPFTGISPSAGVSINITGDLLFNNGNSVLPVKFTPDGLYEDSFQIIKRIVGIDPQVAAYTICYVATVTLTFDTNRRLFIRTLKSEEYSPQFLDTLSNSQLHFINSKADTTHEFLDYQHIGTSNSTLNGANPSVGGGFLPINIPINNAGTHVVTLDAAKPESLGGFVIVLDRLKGYLA